jgi:hypothetical protein
MAAMINTFFIYFSFVSKLWSKLLIAPALMSPVALLSVKRLKSSCIDAGDRSRRELGGRCKSLKRRGLDRYFLDFVLAFSVAV